MYSSDVRVIKSSSFKTDNKLPATLLAKLSPIKVKSGSPLCKHSLAVVWPPNG